jgi:glycosyltransferase involved in cell wall biosynthesis
VLVHQRGRTDIQFGVVGSGECLPGIRQLTKQLGVEDHVTFTGWVGRDVVSSYLSTADLGLQPDPPGPFNDLCSMVKTLEYMAFGLPVLAFDLVETRRAAGEAAAYAEGSTPEQYADAIERVLDDPRRRTEMARAGWGRAHGELSWDRQKPIYLGVVEALIGPPAPPVRLAGAQQSV